MLTLEKAVKSWPQWAQRGTFKLESLRTAARQSRSESATIRIRKFSQAADGWRATPASHQRPEKMATLVPLSGELSSVIALVR
jgi:hypothetical protein